MNKGTKSDFESNGGTHSGSRSPAEAHCFTQRDLSVGAAAHDFESFERGVMLTIEESKEHIQCLNREAVLR